jgi:hypothetical protein
MSAAELAWVAGIFEGEGHVHAERGHAERIRVGVASSDRDVLDRIVAFTGVGKVYGPYVERKGHKPMYRYWCSHPVNAVALLRALLPWLCVRRTERITELLAAYVIARPGARD